jgi:serine phosphatase RsbU (regulator of sigma subunit)
LAKSARPASATQRFWQSLPLRSYSLFLGGVFCLFGTFGFLSDVKSGGASTTRELVFDVLFSGVMATIWVVAATRSRKLVVVAIALFIFSIARPDRDGRPPVVEGRGIGEVRRLEIDAVGTTIGVVLAYACFIVFVGTEGRRHLRAQAEIALARELHQAVAPPIDRRLARFEFFGTSIPSSEVGGDLVDVAVVDDGWTACIADVSGHGVASGTLMAMFKSAARSLLQLKREPDALLTDLNRVIFDLKRSDMFITCALLSCAPDGTLRFALAGHLPILHYRDATGLVAELSFGQLPVAMFDDQVYRTMPVAFERGDVFALVTDGLTEVFDTSDNELGLNPLKDVIAAHARQPLPEILEAVFARARSHGPQADDQSLLLIRCL